MNKQISDQALASQIDKLPKEMQPSRDLWSGIERAIQNKSQQSAFESKSMAESKPNKVVPIAWAASLIAAVLVAWISFAPTPPLSTPLMVNIDETAEQIVNSMHSNFQQQKQVMLVSYGQPDMTNLPIKMQNQLTELAQARKAIEKALANDGNNIDLLNLLRFTQQQELNLLQKLYPLMSNKNGQWQTI